jgi:protease II
MAKLNQILAIEKGLKTRVYAEFTELHNATQKPPLMNGFHKSYQPRDEDGETYPAESQKVQHNAAEVFDRVATILTELFDITATKDWANCQAKADVVIDGRVLVKDAPATYLLFLEKQLSDLTTFVAKMAELDPGSDWSVDPSTGLFRTEPSTTQRTKKLQRPIVLYDATDSGALPAPRKKQLLARIERLSNAVKFAREQANAIEAPDQKLGQAVLSYLFAP